MMVVRFWCCLGGPGLASAQPVERVCPVHSSPVGTSISWFAEEVSE